MVVGGRLLLTRLPEGAWLALPGVAGIALEIVTGFAIGWLAGLLGVGGGVILVPILTLLFGVPQHAAQGVSLFMIVPTSIVGAWTQLRLGAVEKPIVAPVAIASVVAAVAAAAIAHQLPGGHAAPALRRAPGRDRHAHGPQPGRQKHDGPRPEGRSPPQRILKRKASCGRST